MAGMNGIDDGRLDLLGWRGKIGIVVPSTNTAVQPEMEAMRPAGVTNHIGRMSIPNMALNSDADFEALIAALARAESAAIQGVMSCVPRHLILGLSAETFWNGIDAAHAATEALRQNWNVGISAASEALIALLRATGLTRIAVLTPYQPVGDAKVAAFLAASGLTVTAVEGLRCASPVATAQVTRGELTAALTRLAGTGPDAIVQVGTNLPVAELAAEATHWLGVPVLATNAVLYRHALAAIGALDATAFDARWLPGLCGRLSA